MWVPSLAMVLVRAQLWLDDLDGARTTIDALGTNPSQPAVLTEVRRPGYASQAEVARDDLVAAERLALHAETAADQLGLPTAAFGRAEPALTMADVAFERDQLDVAQARVEQLMRIVDHGRRPLVELAGTLLFAIRADADVARSVRLLRWRRLGRWR